MSETNPKATKEKIHKTRRKKYLFRRYILLSILGLTYSELGFTSETKWQFITPCILRIVHKKLKKFGRRNHRINKIITEYNDKSFRFRYFSLSAQTRDIKWDNLTIANGSIPLSL